MPVQPGRYEFGADCGTITLLTARDGLASQVGHDLVIEVGNWSGEVEVTDELTATGIMVRADMNSLSVRGGSGGVRPLTDRDRRDILGNARRVLRADRHPQATFRAPGFEPAADGSGAVEGTLTLAGTSRPLRLRVSQTGPQAYHAEGQVRQSDFGIKPYTAFLGALRVSDEVGISVDVDLAGSPRQLPGDRP